MVVVDAYMESLRYSTYTSMHTWNGRRGTKGECLAGALHIAETHDRALGVIGDEAETGDG